MSNAAQIEPDRLWQAVMAMACRGAAEAEVPMHSVRRRANHR